MNDKELVAHEALKYIKNNSIVGLGTGSTANLFIEALAQKIKKDLLTINPSKCLIMIISACL